jgi:hypothetical protein
MELTMTVRLPTGVGIREGVSARWILGGTSVRRRRSIRYDNGGALRQLISLAPISPSPQELRCRTVALRARSTGRPGASLSLRVDLVVKLFHRRYLGERPPHPGRQVA